LVLLESNASPSPAHQLTKPAGATTQTGGVTAKVALLLVTESIALLTTTL
jgi:hypothetical protein